MYYRPIRQTVSWDSQATPSKNGSDEPFIKHPALFENGEEEGEQWSSDYSNSEDEDTFVEQSEVCTCLFF